MTRQYKSISLAAALAAAFALSANAAIIGVNIGNSNTNNNIAPADVAGVVAATNWNNKLASFGAAQVTDNTGSLLATTVSVSTQWSGNLGSAPATPNHALMGSGTDSGGGDMSATITAIPYDLYDVYVYFGSRNAANNRFGDYTVTPSGTGASGGEMLRGYDIGAFTGTFILEDGSGTDTSNGGNYMVFRDVSGPNLVINASPENPSTPRAPLNGFQIVQVPEPSTTMLFGFAGVALALRRRR